MFGLLVDAAETDEQFRAFCLVFLLFHVCVYICCVSVYVCVCIRCNCITRRMSVWVTSSVYATSIFVCLNNYWMRENIIYIHNLYGKIIIWHFVSAVFILCSVQKVIPTFSLTAFLFDLIRLKFMSVCASVCVFVCMFVWIFFFFFFSESLAASTVDLLTEYLRW